jgi:hypothetical protein
VLEVFLTSWRGKRGAKLEERALDARQARRPGGPRHTDEIAHNCHRQHTRRIAFLAADVLMSGAVLGGGSDALHQMVLVFTNYFESAKGKVKGLG